MRASEACHAMHDATGTGRARTLAGRIMPVARQGHREPTCPEISSPVTVRPPRNSFGKHAHMRPTKPDRKAEGRTQRQKRRQKGLCLLVRGHAPNHTEAAPHHTMPYLSPDPGRAPPCACSIPRPPRAPRRPHTTHQPNASFRASRATSGVPGRYITPRACAPATS